MQCVSAWPNFLLLTHIRTHKTTLLFSVNNVYFRVDRRFWILWCWKSFSKQKIKTTKSELIYQKAAFYCAENTSNRSISNTLILSIRRFYAHPKEDNKFRKSAVHPTVCHIHPYFLGFMFPDTKSIIISIWHMLSAFCLCE